MFDDLEQILETDRLTVRMFTEDDFDSLALILGDPDVMKFSLGGAMNREEAYEYFERRFLGHYATFGFGLWALVHREERAIVGFAGLIVQDIDEQQEVELAYRLAPQYWGKGLASEAAGAIRDYAFQELGLKRLISIIEPRNVRSVRVAKKMGMRVAFKDVYHGFNVDIYECTNRGRA